MAWVTPTSGSGWPVSPEKAWNDNEGDWAESDVVVPGNWTPWFTWGHAALDCDRVRIWSGHGYDWLTDIEVEAYYNGDWQPVYNGGCYEGEFATYSLGGTYSVTQMRARRYNPEAAESEDIGYFIEADFGTPEAGGAVGSLIESRLVGGMLAR